MDNRSYEEICGFTCVEATAYLKGVGLWERTKEEDGYTIVETARRHKAKVDGLVWCNEERRYIDSA
ncbi:hypothetical protein LCGC14_0410980 [marine sediment metagenome]|uniref:Uncharacterized protein n=1 Tax=marine sediment metagenome TaxID=412755 RepID=A0A0F9TBT1_9ZZZZ